MTDLKIRELKMQEARKHTPWRDFVKDICSWRPMTFYKIWHLVSRYPNTSRINKVIGHKEAIEQRDILLQHGVLYNSWESFFSQMGLIKEFVWLFSEKFVYQFEFSVFS